MKKLNYFFVLAILLLTGCAYNRAPFQDYPVQTEVQLNQANFRVVGTVFGYSRQVYIFGVGGVSKKSLTQNAIMDMYENAHLKGSQAIVNVTTAFTTSSALGIYSSQRAVSRGTIIEFLDDSGNPVSSYPEQKASQNMADNAPKVAEESPAAAPVTTPATTPVTTDKNIVLDESEQVFTNTAKLRANDHLIVQNCSGDEDAFSIHALCDNQWIKLCQTPKLAKNGSYTHPSDLSSIKGYKTNINKIRLISQKGNKYKIQLSSKNDDLYVKIYNSTASEGITEDNL